MPLLNLGIVAHVDAGKTSLTERLLYDAGALPALGRVDAGTTRTDSLEMERRRGITIRAAVASFTLHGVTVNLLDTPGHPDFVAEVDRVLSVLDGAVLVVSAVEGVQAHTHVLMRALRRLRIPALVFVNKTDRRGARPGEVERQLGERLGVPVAGDRPEELADVLSRHDDTLLADLVDGRRPDLGAALAEQTRAGLVHPVFRGSALTGEGIDRLTHAITTLLPRAPEDAGAPLAATVFKVEREAGGGRVAYARIRTGTLRVRDRLAQGKVTRLRVLDAPAAAAPAGHIAKIWGLTGARIGDTLGDGAPDAGGHFPPPTLRSVVVPEDPARLGDLHAALAQLADQDPLIGLTPDPLSVTLYGEVQQEVITETLTTGYGLRARFEPAATIRAERLAGPGADERIIGAADNPWLATVGLRVEPGAPAFTLAVEPGSMPAAFFAAVGQAVHDGLAAGPHGWRVLDCRVTMTRSGYDSVGSTAGDFRRLTRVVVAEALRRAGTRVCDPIHRVELDLPAAAVAAVLPVLGGLGGLPLETHGRGRRALLVAEMPSEHVDTLRRRLPGLTHGEGVLEAVFDRYSS
ncbi:GTP-binding protein [Symbioplanes lichenis]|uniref:GTP-binding protein n=1 Tax=Symbioplanes lichenis TaxID=1629072 RepID=UPI0027385F72|nr:GTP-binding protein [Actinoplanes lichenis]